MLYQFLIANGRADFQMIKEFFHEFPFEELFRLVNEKKVSVHYEQLGKAWYRAPYYRSRPKDPVREYVLKNPGVSPTEAMKALDMNRATFYKRVKELGIVTEKDGNNAKLYVEEVSPEDPFKQFQKDPAEDREAFYYSPTPSEDRGGRSEPVAEPEDPVMTEAKRVYDYFSEFEEFELGFEEVLEDLRSGGDLVRNWAISQIPLAAQVMELEEFTLDDLKETFTLTQKEAARIRNHMGVYRLIEESGEGTWRVL